MAKFLSRLFSLLLKTDSGPSQRKKKTGGKERIKSNAKSTGTTRLMNVNPYKDVVWVVVQRAIHPYSYTHTCCCCIFVCIVVLLVVACVRVLLLVCVRVVACLCACCCLFVLIKNDNKGRGNQGRDRKTTR